MKPYCTQNQGDCSTCSLVNYGRDCQNNIVGQGGPGRNQGRKPGSTKPETVVFYRRVTPTEKELLEKYLKKLRADE